MVDPTNAYKPDMLDRYRTHRRVLWFVPAAIFVLWVAGISNYRSWPIEGRVLLALLISMLGLKFIASIWQPPRSRFFLPWNGNLRSLALQVGAITACVGLVIGGLVEAGVPEGDPGYGTPWLLRTCWHGACAFGGSYTSFLGRHLPRPMRARTA